jgi:hypothetical protein
MTRFAVMVGFSIGAGRDTTSMGHTATEEHNKTGLRSFKSVRLDAHRPGPDALRTVSCLCRRPRFLARQPLKKIGTQHFPRDLGKVLNRDDSLRRYSVPLANRAPRDAEGAGQCGYGALGPDRPP